MQPKTSVYDNLIQSISQDSVGWEDAPFLARLTAVYTPTSGAQNGINLYSFVEQSFTPGTGVPVDAVSGRQTVGSSPPTSTYALEVNNALLTVPGPTPTGYTNPGPYVEMRLKGHVGGVPVYEFAAPMTLLYSQAGTTGSLPITVYVGSGTQTVLQTITLPIGGQPYLVSAFASGYYNASSSGGGRLMIIARDTTENIYVPGDYIYVAYVDSVSKADYGSGSFSMVYTPGSNNTTLQLWAIALGASTSDTATITLQNLCAVALG